MSDSPSAPRLNLPSYVVIPARLASTRLPNKMLLRETGKTMLQHTYEGALTANRPLGVCIATEDEEIANEVMGFGGQVIMTNSGFESGTDRLAHVAASAPFSGVEIVVNVQGDEPEIAGATIDEVIRVLEEDPTAQMATLASPLRRREDLENPACVKCLVDENGRALYFSRAAVPHVRDWDDAYLAEDPPRFLHHVGVYAYRRDFLIKLGGMSRGSLERLENLEQLRVLEAGYSMAVGMVDETVKGIDTASDYQAFVQRRRSA